LVTVIHLKHNEKVHGDVSLIKRNIQDLLYLTTQFK